ncbi:SDR family oxidoreductase [Mycobacterium sp.]|uniref:SDR family oxidoreductase n=1 Tax=Mycobacterium sp. TaxID=1785 RepID=UPI003BAD279E
MSLLQGKIAVVTGGTRGIGRAISVELARRGAYVVMHFGRDETAADKAVQLIRSAGGACSAVRQEIGTSDVSADLWRKILASLEKAGLPAAVDILVNNCGITLPRHIEAVQEDEFDKVFAINTKAPFFIAKNGLQNICDNGRIVNISSGVTRFVLPRIIAYSMTKGALDTFSTTLALHVAPRGITVNSVSPGFTQTDINPTLKDPKMMAEAAAVSAFGRIGQPQDIAQIVAFLASDDSQWITGQIIDASGGGFLGF